VSYKTQALLAKDNQLLDRVTACAASEGLHEPGNWAYFHRWQLSAEPGWDAAYSYAVTANTPNPGNDEGVITDGMILTSVQAMVTAEATPLP
jgi:hypothetical protein